jgi:hypothetical protein
MKRIRKKLGAFFAIVLISHLLPGSVSAERLNLQLPGISVEAVRFNLIFSKVKQAPPTALKPLEKIVPLSSFAP